MREPGAKRGRLRERRALSESEGGGGKCVSGPGMPPLTTDALLAAPDSLLSFR